MKLLLCIQCNEVFSLSTDGYRECKGGHCGGEYVDHINAEVWGDPKKMFVLGFGNGTVVDALRGQLDEGDLPPRHMSGYGKVSPGREFDAFIIPESAGSVKRSLNRPPR
jgi:hypothetical protein